MPPRMCPTEGPFNQLTAGPWGGGGNTAGVYKKRRLMTLGTWETTFAPSPGPAQGV